MSRSHQSHEAEDACQLRRTKRCSLVRVAVLFAIATETWFAPAWPAAAQSDDTTAQAVTVVEVKRMCLAETLQVTGLLVPRRDNAVRSSKDGLQVKDILVEPGDTVSSGQVLARLKQPEGSKDSGDVVVNAGTSGVIYARSALVGAIVTAAGEPLFRIAQDGEIELSADAPVDTIFHLAKGQTATIDVIGVGELPGTVRLVSTTINPTTQLGNVRVFISTDRRLRVGAFARGTINVGQRCGPLVPISALLYGGEGAIVQVVRDGLIETRRVTVGLIKDGNAEIQDGLAPGETVVARAGAFVRDGDRVRTRTDSSAAK